MHLWVVEKCGQGLRGSDLLCGNADDEAPHYVSTTVSGWSRIWVVKFPEACQTYRDVSMVTAVVLKFYLEEVHREGPML
jgi:hypothetical protein